MARYTFQAEGANGEYVIFFSQRCKLLNKDL